MAQEVAKVEEIIKALVGKMGDGERKGKSRQEYAQNGRRDRHAVSSYWIGPHHDEKGMLSFALYRKSRRHLNGASQ
jgi:hypothetical protein